ncbi:hypothetical protein AX774_g1740 [Zancudomyces culisetae]|uniref:Spermidine synthase n=1 Tax=Zancudomyces culisetae TaxID=1213189 RepID=A0A1R1PV29_ZANCU|nr:hypothetical protein AX774_g1740 [Zancudomyces culisetae]|eukprot:OMH84732.1 hypothetical protein AX774_g1740 [Zancudomyces culisetae]
MHKYYSGLGIGVSAKSLHQQNVVVDVVEYDAAVVHSALNYFDLPNDLNAIHISDGRHFIFNTTSTYDYVIHDIFSNGFISPHLFSVQVLQQIKRILRPDGVFAMNFVAFNDDKHTLCSIKNTLLTAFKNVRLYTESLDKGDSKEQKTVKNIVFFASDLPVKFDFPQEVLAGHSIRSRMLQSLAKNELLLDGCTAGPTGSSDNSVGAVINDGDFGVFNKYTVDVAVNHWYIMRNVFPTEFWMDY